MSSLASMLFILQLWKERNRRVFEAKTCSFRQLAAIIHDEVLLLLKDFNTGAE
jgi:hypothetical protein